MAPGDALALVAGGGCHAAWLDGPAPPSHTELLSLPVAERAIGIAVAPGNPLGVESVAGLRDDRVRAVAGPAAPDELPENVTRMRSDAAALAAVTGGHADCAVVSLPAARAAGVQTHATHSAPVAVAVRRDLARREPGLAALKGALADPSLAAALRAEGYEPLAYVRSVA
jgi:molybdate-binding protein